MTVADVGLALLCGAGIGLIVVGVARMVGAFDRHATKTINAHLDAALAHGDEWLGESAGDDCCFDCAADRAVAIGNDREPSNLADMPHHPERLGTRDDYIDTRLRVIEEDLTAGLPGRRVWRLSEETNP